jgi:hypothetical protein
MLGKWLETHINNAPEIQCNNVTEQGELDSL